MLATLPKLWLCLPSPLLSVVVGFGPVYNESIDGGVLGQYPVHSYMTEPTLSSPLVNMLQWDAACDDGRLYFLTPRGEYVENPGPMILDAAGDLVWTQPFETGHPSQAYNLQVQRYQGEDYLTFWLGDDAVHGHGDGVLYMLNSSYDIVHTFGAAGELFADLHEFVITSQGTALLTVYDVVVHDLSSIRISSPSSPPAERMANDNEDQNFIWDCLVQEVDIHTGELLFEWRASDHVDVSNTYYLHQNRSSRDWPYDWFHINSVLKDDVGNYLISARYTHSIIYINGRTGDILWTLGGRHNQFMDLSNGTALNFAWQHDARFHALDAFLEIYTPPTDVPQLSRKLVTLFDNAAEDQHYDYGADVSRGLLLEITYPSEPPNERIQQDHRLRRSGHVRDLNSEKLVSINGSDPAYTVRLIQQYENPRALQSSSQGSLQVLDPSKGNARTKMLVGYGLNAVWTEFDVNGTVLCNAHFGAQTSWEHGGIQSYRTFKYPWTGRPRTNPKLSISHDGLRVFTSWNGATEVRQWLLQGSDSGSWHGLWFDVISVNKTGFETAIDLSVTRAGLWPNLRIMALDCDGNALDYGTSEAIDNSAVASQRLSGATTVIDRITGQDLICMPVIFVAMTAMLAGSYRLFARWRNSRDRRPSARLCRLRKDMWTPVLHGEA